MKPLAEICAGQSCHRHGGKRRFADAKSYVSEMSIDLNVVAVPCLGRCEMEGNVNIKVGMRTLMLAGKPSARGVKKRIGSIEQVLGNIFCEKEDVGVQMQEYHTSLAPHMLYTTGVSTCIGVGAMYHGRGYLFHSIGWKSDVGVYLDQMFSNLYKRVTDKDDVQFYVVGGAYTFDESGCLEPEVITDLREYTIKRIEDEGYTNVQVQWCAQDGVQDLKLDIGNGVGEIVNDYFDGFSGEEDFFA